MKRDMTSNSMQRNEIDSARLRFLSTRIDTPTGQIQTYTTAVPLPLRGKLSLSPADLL